MATQSLASERVATLMATESGKLSIIIFSGTADKFIPLGVLSQAAAAMGTEVNIFVTGFALLGFTKAPHELPFPPKPRRSARTSTRAR
jgi:peroxiredoxin family protein